MIKDLKKLNLIIIFSILLSVFFQIQYSIKLEKNKELSSLADGYSEGNSLRGSLYFKEQGLLKTSGLPDFHYSNLYPKYGEYQENSKYIYTHYPPGPEYTLLIMRFIFGDHSTLEYRIFSIILSSILAFFFLNTLMTVLNNKFSIIPALLIIITPMFTNTMHGLHQTTYCFYLNLFYLGSLFLYIDGRVKLKQLAFISFIISFIQGWMTFDYFFLLAFTHIVILLLFNKLNKQNLIILLISNSGAFALAHGIHFLQVVNYHESITIAFNDIFHAAKHRASGEKVHFFDVLYSYFDYYLRRARNFNFKIQYLFIIHIAFCVFYKFNNNSKQFKYTLKITAITLVAFIISSLWMLAMTQHAMVHTHFIPRHYFLSYIVLIIGVFKIITNYYETRTKKSN